MRKILLSFLLATAAAAPALAQRPHRGDDDSPRESAHQESRSDRSDARSEKSESRSQRSEARQDERPARAERSDRSDQAANPERHVDVQRPAVVERQVDVQRPEAGGGHGRVQREAIVERRADERQSNVEIERNVREARPSNVNERGRPTLGENRSGGDSVTNWRKLERSNVSEGGFRAGELSKRLRVRPPAEARPDRPAPRPETASRDKHRNHWRTDWRHDHRYDWHNHRHHHRSLFHLGFYFDPFGWSYHRWGIGWRLWPSYYSSNYWLNDPYQYRLPNAPWPYRWVRYYDDALLVDTYTGEVVDVIYDFFW